MNNLEKETMEMAKRAARKYVYDEIDWEQRRYEIAKNILAGFASSGGLYGESMSNDVGYAIHIADELIKQLKGGKPCE